MPLDSISNDPNLIDLRRRAGLPALPQTVHPQTDAPQSGAPTPAYDKLNPASINVPMSEADLTSLIAVLEYVQQVKELAPTSQLLFKLKKMIGRQKPYQHDPVSPDNPFRQTAMLTRTP